MDLQSTRGLENISVLPPHADISILTYGLTFSLRELDYRLNPLQKEFNWKQQQAPEIKPYERIQPSIQFLRQPSPQINKLPGRTCCGCFYTIGGRHVLNVGNIDGYMYNPEIFSMNYFGSEVLKSLCGLMKNQFMHLLLALKIEYRYLLEQNSFCLHFLTEHGMKTKPSGFTDTPFGFGAGMILKPNLASCR